MVLELNTSLPTNVQHKSFDDTFGNYLLHGIDEVILPELVAWWPQTLAWKVLALGVLLTLCSWAYRAIRRWLGDRYRRMALKKLDQLFLTYKDAPQSLQQLPVILKATALHAYPRIEIAHLSGVQWLKVLDSKCKTTNFSSSVGAQLLTISYQPIENWQLQDGGIHRLFDLVRRWLKDHKPKERGPDNA